MSSHAPYSHEDETEQAYRTYLDELQPLPGWDGLPFSLLLKEGDPTAYELGLVDYRDQQEGNK